MSVKRVPVEPGEEREGDLVIVNGVEHRLTVLLGCLMVKRDDVFLHPGGFRELGAEIVREVEEEPEHPHGLIPTEVGAVIHIGSTSNPYRPAYMRRPRTGWERTGNGIAHSDEEMQRLADRHGFERLVPESLVANARAEGHRGAFDAALDALSGMQGHAGTLARAGKAIAVLRAGGES